MNIKSRLAAADWSGIQKNMHEKGYAQLPGLLTKDECEAVIERYNEAGLYRKTVTMERYRFGLGEYRYFDYPLPALIQTLRETVYPQLVPVANTWMQVLQIENRFPESFNALQDLCHKNGQLKPTPLILKYGEGGHNTLHQDLYGDVFFPMQIVLFLSEPDVDYTGGEFVLTQQTPRAQSKAIVLKPHRGDMLIFTTNFRPVKGVRGYYRVNMRHGVSEVHSGVRYTLGIIFHDARI